MAHAPVYLDSHATTPVDPRVLKAMLPYFTEHFGNPASASHAWGWKAQEAVEAARRDVAALIGAVPREIIFTSGATESNNFAINGVAASTPAERRGIITTAIEHKSVLEMSKRLGAEGWRVTILPVARDGRIDLAALASALASPTALVSVMAANNEIGVIQALAEIGALAHAAGALLHVDAAQAAGKIPIDVNTMQIDLLSLTGHKMYGPKGCGALHVRRRTELAPLIIGGGQERGMRSGTLNVPGIVGLGQACAIGRAEMAEESARLATLRDRLLAGLRAGIEGVTVNGSLEHRLPHNLHVSFADVDHASLIVGISDIAVSAGSACGSASAEPSHVLQAIGGDASGNAATIRFGIGRFTTDEEIDYTIEKFTTVVRKLRDTAPGSHTRSMTTANEDHRRA
ncbi:MAG TPA: aminotransferase class V-fold PLP-dependent enzyme [Vicinamibacterales bacterium]|nr:aminotransferase class V-fold PLP-dependent enzyme [Vicinamibacterales bacterium]